MFIEGANEAEADVTKLVSLPPAETVIEANSPAVQVAVGLHHTRKFVYLLLGLDHTLR